MDGKGWLGQRDQGEMGGQVDQLYEEKEGVEKAEPDPNGQ